MASSAWLLAGLAGLGVLGAAAGACALRRLIRTRRAVAWAEHELRGPLGAVLLAVDLGLRDDGLGAGQLSAVRAELRRAERALGDLSRARRGLAPVMTVTEVDVPGVVRQSVEAWRPVAVTCGVTLEFSEQARCRPLLGDPVRLAQATGNLIANAIEHGGSRVHVTAANAACGINVAVTDDGPGLPRGLVPGGRRLAVAERGHGLAIVAGIAAAHGGRLRSSGRDGCASLVLELPDASRG